MRFLYKLNELFPRVTDSGRSTLNLRFVISKQLLSQLNALKSNIQGDNTLNIEGWKEYFAQKERISDYAKIFDDYSNKYIKNKNDF